MEFFQGPAPFYITIGIVLVPLLGFLIQIFFSGKLPRNGDFVPTGAIGISAVLALILGWHMFKVYDPDLVYDSKALGYYWNWFDFGSVKLQAGVYLDNAGIVMLMMVTVVSFFIHLFSIGYMHGDRYYGRFFAYLGLFCFSMLGLVASDNILFMFIFWELVGFCSYLLIGFFFYEDDPPRCANKAFLVNKVGDGLFLLGILIIWHVTGTFNFQGMFSAVESGNWISPFPGVSNETLLTIAGILVFGGAVSKSAQFPLHVWLPDAMAGPTPVSALIHAATMVAAGVFMVGRMYPFFTTTALVVIAIVGAITAVFAATMGIVNNDIKKVLAYSTCSQLGYMVLALGVGGFMAGLFHLITHACFKACLFLGSGSVIHAVHTQDMREMGGLRKKMPITYATFLISTLALTGVPCLSGYFTKDTIVANALEWGMAKGAAAYIPFLFAAVGAFMTMFYMMRLIIMTFHGEPKDQHKYDHAHESPPVMTIPLIALAILAIFVAGTILPWHTANDTWYADLVKRPDAACMAETAAMPEQAQHYEHLYEEMHHAEHSAHYIALGTSLPLVVLGFFLAMGFYYWKRFSAAKCAEAIRPIYNTVSNKYYLDHFNDIVFVRGLIKLCFLVKNTLEAFIDFLVNFSGLLMRFVSFIHGMFDKYVVDSCVNFWWWTSHLLSGIFRVAQTGSAKDYLALALLGVVVVSLVMLFAF
ncbi:MAG: NADH-quinone oxidoreductase subunit L [Planctomycetota bacterium]|jgi:NADH-quinone oxidoreductase subunit L